MFLTFDLMFSKKTYRIVAYLLIVQWLLVQIIAQFPNFVETYYAKGIYPYIAVSLRYLLGWLPFSVGDLLYIHLGYAALRSFFKMIKTKKIAFTKSIAILSALYFWFHLFWGLNYYRNPLYKTINITNLTYSTIDLERFTNKLINKTNTLQHILATTDTVAVINPSSKKEIYKNIANGYANLSANYHDFTYKQSSIKSSLLSLPLTYMGFSGYLNPLTAEAQVNDENPSISYAVISCHEVAHQLGYAAENEANFIGFLAAINNKDTYIQYSGYFMALRYALNDLYRKDQKKYAIALAKINKGVIKNMQQSQDFWNAYNNPFETYFKSIFNQFLKANKQPKGIKSYNGMLGMLINFEKQHANELKLLN